MNIKIRDISKAYDKHLVLDRVSFDVISGEIISIIGPSGSGKSTFLHILAGLLPASSGTIYMDEQTMEDVPTETRNIGFVFQEPSLYPNLNVYKNIAFPLEMQRLEKNEIRRKVTAAANMLHIEHLLKRKPHQISGGEQQRVAIARAFVKKPALIFFDEPFSSLDARLALELREELKQLIKATGTTAIFVTHSQDDAISISDKIAVLHQGRLLQFDSPANVYNHPSCAFVANFIGQYPINKVQGELYNGMFVSNDGVITIPAPEKEMSTSHVQILFRPESVMLAKMNTIPKISGVVADVFTNGKENVVTLSVGSNTIRFYTPAEIIPAINETVDVCIDSARVFFFDVAGENL